MSIATSSGHRFGMKVKSITTGITGVVTGITQCIAGCELLEVNGRDNKGSSKTYVFSSKLVEIVDSDLVEEYEAIFAKTNHKVSVRLGDQVNDRISDETGIVGEIQYQVNSDTNVLLVKKYSEYDENLYASARAVSCSNTGHSIHDQLVNNRAKRERGELTVKLMQKAKCIASGATGLVTAIFEQANGTISVGIQPVSEEGKQLNTHYTDIELVQIITEKQKETAPVPEGKPKKSGCLRSHELSSLTNSAVRTA